MRLRFISRENDAFRRSVEAGHNGRFASRSVPLGVPCELDFLFLRHADNITENGSRVPIGTGVINSGFYRVAGWCYPWPKVIEKWCHVYAALPRFARRLRPHKISRKNRRLQRSVEVGHKGRFALSCSTHFLTLLFLRFPYFFLVSLFHFPKKNLQSSV